MSSKAPLVELAPAKINLNLRVLGRRSDGYHEIESLVAFASQHDRLALDPDGSLVLSVDGEFVSACGPDADNLVCRAAAALGRQIEGLKLGRFALTKHLPVAAGLGGGSSDAAAALRLLARGNGVALHDPRLMAAAHMTGADVPVCLDPRPRIMGGIGEKLSPPLRLPPLAALLVNPGIAVPTAAVFAAYTESGKMSSSGSHDDAIALVEKTSGPVAADSLIEALGRSANDLEPPAIALHPLIGVVLAELREMPGCRLARMSGSGATCFALFHNSGAAAAATALTKRRPAWWIRETILAG